jgi:protein involved in polysaccharide export with SLBB domain
MMSPKALHARTVRRELPSACPDAGNGVIWCLIYEKKSIKIGRPVWERWIPAVLAFAIGVAISAGCRSTPPFGQPDQDPVPEAVKLRPGLVISLVVLVAGEKEIDAPAKRVSENGTVVLPLLGEMTVADQSLEELQEKLTKRYKSYYVRPQVMVDFARDIDREGISPWGFVTVLGRVKEPGRVAIPATRDLTVSGAIQQAAASSRQAPGTMRFW